MTYEIFIEWQIFCEDQLLFNVEIHQKYFNRFPWIVHFCVLFFWNEWTKHVRFWLEVIRAFFNEIRAISLEIQSEYPSESSGCVLSWGSGWTPTYAGDLACFSWIDGWVELILSFGMIHVNSRQANLTSYEKSTKWNGSVPVCTTLIWRSNWKCPASVIRHMELLNFFHSIAVIDIEEFEFEWDSKLSHLHERKRMSTIQIG